MSFTSDVMAFQDDDLRLLELGMLDVYLARVLEYFDETLPFVLRISVGYESPSLNDLEDLESVSDSISLV